MTISDEERLSLCKITIEQIFDKNGKPIVRKNPKIKEDK